MREGVLNSECRNRYGPLNTASKIFAHSFLNRAHFTYYVVKVRRFSEVRLGPYLAQPCPSTSGTVTSIRKIDKECQCTHSHGLWSAFTGLAYRWRSAADLAGRGVSATDIRFLRHAVLRPAVALKKIPSVSPCRFRRGLCSVLLSRQLPLQ